jgi:peroxiredoxin
MKRLLSTICSGLIALGATWAVVAQTAKPGGKGEAKTEISNEHHYGSLREADIELKDFTYPTTQGGSIRLREIIKDKNLVILHYFAAWCHNSNYDVKTMTEIHNRYKDKGVLVLGVFEYSKNDEIRAFLEKHNPPYPICIEGGKKLDRTATTHYAYRKRANDDRAWGTPLNLFFSAKDVLGEGDIVASHVRVALGEAIKSEIEEWIQSNPPKN